MSTDTPAPGLSIVPDIADQEEETAAPEGAYTVRDQVLTNAALVKQVIDEYGIEDAAAVSLVGLTFQVHLQKIQLGLTAPVEG